MLVLEVIKLSTCGRHHMLQFQILLSLFTRLFLVIAYLFLALVQLFLAKHQVSLDEQGTIFDPADLVIEQLSQVSW